MISLEVDEPDGRHRYTGAITRYDLPATGEWVLEIRGTQRERIEE